MSCPIVIFFFYFIAVFLVAKNWNYIYGILQLLTEHLLCFAGMSFSKYPPLIIMSCCSFTASEEFCESCHRREYLVYLIMVGQILKCLLGS